MSETKPINAILIDLSEDDMKILDDEGILMIENEKVNVLLRYAIDKE